MKRNKRFVVNQLRETFLFLFINLDFAYTIDAQYLVTKDKFKAHSPGKFKFKAKDITYSEEPIEGIPGIESVKLTIDKYIRGSIESEQRFKDIDNDFYPYLRDGDVGENNQDKNKGFYLNRGNREYGLFFLICCHFTYTFGKRAYGVGYSELVGALQNLEQIEYNDIIAKREEAAELGFIDQESVESEKIERLEKAYDSNHNRSDANWIGNKKTGDKRSVQFTKIVCWKLQRRGLINEYIISGDKEPSSYIFWDNEICGMSKEEATALHKENKDIALIDYEKLISDYPEANLSSIGNEKTISSLMSRIKKNTDFSMIQSALSEVLLKRISTKKLYKPEYINPLYDVISYEIAQKKFKEVYDKTVYDIGTRETDKRCNEEYKYNQTIGLNGYVQYLHTFKGFSKVDVLERAVTNYSEIFDEYLGTNIQKVQRLKR